MSHHQVNQLIHLLWSTDNCQYIIPDSLNSELYAYIRALIKSKNGRVITSGGSSDHVHFLLSLPPEISLGDLLKHVKAYSSRWIKSKKDIDPQFTWQQGYLALSTQANKLDTVSSYIKSEKDRHPLKSYSDELIGMLKLQNIDYHEKYFLEKSYSRILIHSIWSTHERIPYLERSIRSPLYKHIGNRASLLGGIVHEIGGIEDHVHLLLEVPRDKALSNIMRDIKTSATHWLKNIDTLRFRDFSWQTGYGAFTISLSHLDVVKNYIQQQEEHHRKRSFKEAWDDFLRQQNLG